MKKNVLKRKRNLVSKMGVLLMIIMPFQTVKSQVVISDYWFASFLQNHYPGCMTGNVMDTLCPEIVNEESLNLNDYYSFPDITGIEYFKSLVSLECASRHITFLPKLPNSLVYLYAANNYIDSIHSLPSGLKDLYLANNNLDTLPTLPPNLEWLNVPYNHLKALPGLPSTLVSLDCSNNEITEIATLPVPLVHVIVSGNPITSLPPIPANVYILYAQNCDLTSVPELPSGLWYLKLDYNPNLTCLPLLPDRIEQTSAAFGELVFAGTQIACVPNIPAYCANGSNLPLCEENDTVNNPNACTVFHGISGIAYTDSPYDEPPYYTPCQLDILEPMHTGVKFLLLDSLGDTIATDYTLFEGRYHFTGLEDGDYTVLLDTTDMPYTYKCDAPGLDSAVTITDSIAVRNVNFSIKCKDGYFDVGTDTIFLNEGIVAPGKQHVIGAAAGIMNNSYGLICGHGIEGIIEVIIEGPVTAVNPMSWSWADAYPATTSGDTMWYEVTDFSNLGSVQYGIEIDEFADLEDSICVTINFYPDGVDADYSNNYYTYCYPVSESSFARNAMEVYTEIQQPELTIRPYPNPTNGIFSFYLPEQLLTDSGVFATIYNVAGEKISEQLLTQEGIINMDLTNENPGFYLMTLQSGSQLINCKLIKH